MTANFETAYIEAGEEIPYLEATKSGATAVAFKKAVLRLEVTPQMTPDHTVLLDLKVNQDARGAIINGIPVINTRELKTKVLVQNGATVVLGGIYQHERLQKQCRIPFLGDLPLVGLLFKSRSCLNKRHKLLIFVTPKWLPNA